MSLIYKPIRVVPPPINPQDEGKLVENISYKKDSTLPEGYYMTEGHPLTHPGYRYYPAVANPYLPNVLYTRSEAPNEKCGPNLLDRSPKVGVSKDGALITKNGYCSCRANVSIAAGEWYYEVKIIKANEQTNDSHIRIGLSRREFDLSTPVGSDAYSYGLQDKGKKVHAARPKEFMSEYKTGDVIGFHVSLPREPPHDTPYLVRRDRFPIKFGGRLFCETLDYVPTKEMNELLVPKPGVDLKPADDECIPDSFIKVYKNGQLQGTAFENLREFLPPLSKFDKQHKVLDCNDGDAGYFPTISMYRDGQAKFEMGPDFAFNKPETARALSERWEEQIADEIVFDVIDQVHYEITDPVATNKVQGVMPEWQDHFTPAKVARIPKEEIRTSEAPDTKRLRSAPPEKEAAAGSLAVVKEEVKHEPEQDIKVEVKAEIKEEANTAVSHEGASSIPGELEVPREPLKKEAREEAQEAKEDAVKAPREAQEEAQEEVRGEAREGLGDLASKAQEGPKETLNESPVESQEKPQDSAHQKSQEQGPEGHQDNTQDISMDCE